MGQIQTRRRSAGELCKETWAEPKTDDGVLGLSERITTGGGPGTFEIPENPGLPRDELTVSGEGGKDQNWMVTGGDDGLIRGEDAVVSDDEISWETTS